MLDNIFLKVLKLQVVHWNLQVSHGVTLGSVVRHPCIRAIQRKKKKKRNAALTYLELK